MKRIFFTVMVFFTFMIINQKVFSQGKIQVTFDYSDGKIFIFYEFQGDKTKDYEVDIKLKRISDSDFLIIPDKLTGDIGEGKFAGRKNKIIWELSPDEEAQLEGEDFYFDVTALEIEPGGGIPWYVFAGGAALAGGTAAILLLGKKDSDGTTTPPSSDGFPTPPVRP
ncbi:MAG: hypothetical protein A2315_01775 [Ignavibacteria bacterium RIFOXYB2_FULL_35_12]|nr:MAG: hypothetical protein A2X60_05585 [Ignavibacteria bacterium GWF2_35_20]OGU80088.1 MAG: hypothetical protein A2254_07925 [Ignavibacteria bacterium RIFOXYA2_FULL_35_9]OGU85635.1 MAG: hypothetical protein A3K31_13790 [Ignavibacteria bacterium RIFOXYA12_FULL_35_25]OGU96209.1 MAG: hypothetical protein A2347_13335 [Ignavibacteria bacterium RIFOXYB12_FULL_35_14]OGV00398.1 MAG: hypothetical protein A2455_00265 [Ignavibacteria bacterium RIFOXYC2_FULL_35_16]OGV02653.1 MAG: hypothetical protein A2